jgi:hypothetical protein
MDSARVVHRPHSGISQEEARDARARAWAYVFDCHRKHVGKEGGPATAPDDRKGPKHDPAKISISQ